MPRRFALGAFALYHIIDGMRCEAVGEFNLGDMQGLEAESLFARFAVEVNVCIAVVAMPLARAKLIFQHSTSVFKSVYDVVTKKQRQRAEYARLVDGGKCLFKF